jgi:hypothetical protein
MEEALKLAFREKDKHVVVVQVLRPDDLRQIVAETVPDPTLLQSSTSISSPSVARKTKTDVVHLDPAIISQFEALTTKDYHYTLLVAVPTATDSRAHRVFQFTKDEVRCAKPVKISRIYPNAAKIVIKRSQLRVPESQKKNCFTWPPVNKVLIWPGSVIPPDELDVDALIKHIASSMQATAEWSLLDLLPPDARPLVSNRDVCADLLAYYNTTRVGLGDMLFGRLVLPYSRFVSSPCDSVSYGKSIVGTGLNTRAVFTWNDAASLPGLSQWAMAGNTYARTFATHIGALKHHSMRVNADRAHRNHPMMKHLPVTIFSSMPNNNNKSGQQNESMEIIQWGQLFQQMRYDFGRMFIGLSPAQFDQLGLVGELVKEWDQTIEYILHNHQGQNRTLSLAVAWGNLAMYMSTWTKGPVVFRNWISDARAQLVTQEALAKQKRLRTFESGQWTWPKPAERFARYAAVGMATTEDMKRLLLGPHTSPCIQLIIEHGRKTHHLLDTDRVALRKWMVRLLPAGVGRAMSDPVLKRLAEFVLGVENMHPNDKGKYRDHVDEMVGHFHHALKRPQTNKPPSCQDVIRFTSKILGTSSTSSEKTQVAFRCPFVTKHVPETDPKNPNPYVSDLCKTCSFATGPPRRSLVYHPLDRLLHLHETGQLEW